MTSEQVLQAQYWVKEIYLGLMKRRKQKDADKVTQSSKSKKAQNDSSEEKEEINLSDEGNDEKVMQQTEIDQKMPEEVQELLTKVDRYLMLHQFMTANTDKAGFIDVFLVSMLRRGDLQIVDPVEDSEKTKDFRNI